MNARRIIFAAALLAVGVCRADGSWLEPEQFGATFEKYKEGEPLSDIGTTGGSWKEVPTGVETAAGKSEDRSYMEYESSVPGEWIVFAPSNTGTRVVKAVATSVQLMAATELPTMPDDCRASFAIYAPAGGEPTFVGWTATGWQNLSIEDVSPVAGVWYKVATRLAQVSDDSIRVQYRIKVGDDYLPLKNAEGKTWLDAGSKGASGDIVKSVKFWGAGALEHLKGGDQKRGMVLSVVPNRESAAATKP